MAGAREVTTGETVRVKAADLKIDGNLVLAHAVITITMRDSDGDLVESDLAVNVDDDWFVEWVAPAPGVYTVRIDATFGDAVARDTFQLTVRAF